MIGFILENIFLRFYERLYLPPLSVAKTIAIALVTSDLDLRNSIFQNVGCKDTTQLNISIIKIVTLIPPPPSTADILLLGREQGAKLVLNKLSRNICERFHPHKTNKTATSIKKFITLVTKSVFDACLILN